MSIWESKGRLSLEKLLSKVVERLYKKESVSVNYCKMTAHELTAILPTLSSLKELFCLQMCK